MDRELVMATLQSARDTLHWLATGGARFKEEALWRDVQSLDTALEELAKPDVTLVEAAMKLAAPSYIELGRLRGLIASLKLRHPFLEETYRPVGWSMDHQLMAAGRDLWLLCNLLEEQNGNHEQKQPAGSPGPGSEERPVQSGGLGLQRDPALETAPHGSPGGQVQG